VDFSLSPRCTEWRDRIAEFVAEVVIPREAFCEGAPLAAPSTMPSVTLGPVDLYYETAGSGEPVIFIPGFATNLHLWDQQVEPVSRHFQCVRLDLRGQGKSSAPPEGYATADFTADLEGLMDHLNLSRCHLVAASMGGSQLGPYVSGAGRVILVVGTQKIVSDLDEAMSRVYDYSFPLEDARAQAEYGIHSAVNKVLIINREITPGRVTVVLVDEVLGF